MSRILQTVDGHGGMPTGDYNMCKGIETGKYRHVQKIVKNPDQLDIGMARGVSEIILKGHWCHIEEGLKCLAEFIKDLEGKAEPPKDF